MDTTIQYNGFADDYSHIIKEKSKHSRKIYYKYLHFPMVGKKILDVGCGDGTELLYCRKQRAEVYGIDSSKKMISLSKEKIPNANLVVGNFDKLPFRNNFFDVVLSKHAIQSTSNIRPVFKEITRVLKSNGLLVFLTVHPFRQYMEKKKKRKNYFHKEIVESILFNGLIKVNEPTHTLNEYLNELFLKNFDIMAFEESFDPFSAEQVEGDVYPGFFIIKAKKRK